MNAGPKSRGKSPSPAPGVEGPRRRARSPQEVELEAQIARVEAAISRTLTPEEDAARRRGIAAGTVADTARIVAAYRAAYVFRLRHLIDIIMLLGRSVDHRRRGRPLDLGDQLERLFNEAGTRPRIDPLAGVAAAPPPGPPRDATHAPGPDGAATGGETAAVERTPGPAAAPGPTDGGPIVVEVPEDEVARVEGWLASDSIADEPAGEALAAFAGQFGSDRIALAVAFNGTPGGSRPSVSIWVVDETTPDRPILLADRPAQDRLLGDFELVVEGRPRVVRVVARAGV